MTMCVRQYYALIPQLDLIATQCGIEIKDRGAKKLESASATKTRAKLPAKTTGSICTTDRWRPPKLRRMAGLIKSPLDTQISLRRNG
jgi:hypothetical protein